MNNLCEMAFIFLISPFIFALFISELLQFLRINMTERDK